MDLLHNFKFNFGRKFLEPVLTLSNLFRQNHQRTVMFISRNYRIRDSIFVNIAQAISCLSQYTEHVVLKLQENSIGI